MSVQSMNDLVVSIDNRGDSVIVASEERFSVELDVCAVSGLLASELELVDELHAERADEQPGSREGGDHGGVLGVSAGRGDVPLRGSGGRTPRCSPASTRTRCSP